VHRHNVQLGGQKLVMYGHDRKSDFRDFVKKTWFFITAFLPLWVILIVNYSFTDKPLLEVIMPSVVLLTASVVALLLYLKKKQNTKTDRSSFRVVTKSEITHDVVFYVLAYIPALLIQDFTLQEISIFGILLFTVYVLYIKTNMLHINPIIALKYHTYRVIDEHDNSVVVFSSLHLKTDRDIAYQEITTNLHMVVD